MLAQFIGKDKSMGFRKWRTYNITFEMQHLPPYWIILREENGLFCPYSSMEAVLENWRIFGNELPDFLCRQAYSNYQRNQCRC